MTALFTIVYQPFLPYKRSERTLRIARERGFETVVAWDHRNSRSDYEHMRSLADAVVPFTSHGLTENGYRVMRHIRSEFALILADDEEPSAPLWDISAAPPSPSRFGVTVVPVLGDLMAKDHIGPQERLVWTDGFHIRARPGMTTLFEGEFHSEAPRVVLGYPHNRGWFIWHYLLEAPLEEREAKARRYESLDPRPSHRQRLFPSNLIPIPNEMRRYLPDGERSIGIQADAVPAHPGR